MDKTYAFLDLETTGLDPGSDDIIEIGVVTANAQTIIDRYRTFVKPARKLPRKIVKLTGITDNMLKRAPQIEDVKAKLLTFIGELPVVGHNISFDLGFLNNKLGVALKNQPLDTMDFVQVVFPKAASYRLEYIKGVLGINEGNSHRALDDAETACRIFFNCLKVLQNLNEEVLLNIYKMFKDREGGFASVLTSYVFERIASFPAGKTTAPYAFLQDGPQEDDVLFNGSEDAETLKKIEIADLAEILLPTGPLAKKFPQYKYRPEQAEMLTTVVQGFQESKHMIVEAGTGTGKSLAYLLPAIMWATINKTKVTVATHTINLQEQLWNKDLPGIRETLGLNFKAALVKGRTNYLCLRRWEAKLKVHEGIEDKEMVFILKVLVWLTSTNTGDKSELNILPNQYMYWNELSSEQESCLGPSCPWFHKHCFVLKARKQAETADLLIANHSLLLADVKIQNRLLPAFDYLIIDEAHHLENTATEQLGWTVSLNNLRSTLFYLIRGFGAGLGPGLFNQTKQTVRNNSALFSPADLEKLDMTINDAFEKVKTIYESIKETEDYLRQWPASLYQEGDNENYRVTRVKNSHRSEEAWGVFVSIKENFLVRTGSLVNSLKKVLAFLETEDSEEKKVFVSHRKDIEFHANYLQEVISDINLFIHGSADYVYWVETDSGIKADVKIRSAPVSVSGLLFENLFRTKKSTLLTSATISVDGSFEHFCQRVGLDCFPDDKVIKRMLSSPFSYERQSLLCIVRDIPDPAKVDDADYTEYVIPLIRDIARVFCGKTLVLFTSHRMLRDVYQKLQPELESDGITLLGHKIDGGRSRLTEEFRRSESAVLLGASSFWEGIDLPGDILRCVVIVRLPFAPPTTPIVEARIEELLKNKKDAFYGYSVPEAVIKLKQGFGRLIRAEDDDGVVVVLDRRIVDRRYGRKFLNSLPIKTHFRGDTPTVLQKMTDWVQGERPQFSTLNLLENSKDIEEYLKKVNKTKGS